MPSVGSAVSARRRIMLLPIAIVALVAAAIVAERNWPAVRELRLDTAPPAVSKHVSMSKFNGVSADAFATPCISTNDLALLGASALADVERGTMKTCVTERLASGAQEAGVLTQITTWRREGNSVVLIRSPGLRHRLGTN